MLSLRRSSAGFSLIELLVTVTLIGVLLALAVPTFGNWNSDARVRATAESLLNAVRITQSTAVARGRTAMLALTSDAAPAYTSTPVANGTNWFLLLNPMNGSDETAATLGMIQSATVASQNKVTITGPAVTCFNSLGQQSTLAAASTSVGVACTAPTSDTTPNFYEVGRTDGTRKFKILMYLGGQSRMCDEAKTLSNTNPDGCP